jgi:uncharacterized protein YfaS (alpha-2-macroglobulin family)
MENKKLDKNFQLTDAEFLTRREGALFLRLSQASFDKLNIDRIKYGKSVRFSVSDLRAYAKEHKVGCKKDE